MSPRNTRVTKAQGLGANGIGRDQLAPSPIVDLNAPRSPLRYLTNPASTIEPVYTQYSSTFPTVPLYTPLNVPPLGTFAGTIAERYVPPHLRSLPIRPAPTVTPQNVTPTKPFSTFPANSSRSTKSYGPSGKPIKSTVPKLANITSPQRRPPPSPTPDYLSQASKTPTRLSKPANLLVILDLNGTLIHRKGKSHHSFTPRPYLSPFLEYCFKEHSVMVWSSARPENVARMCDYLFTRAQRKKLVAEWGRDTLGLTGAEYREKVQVYKLLTKVWGNEALQKRSCPGYVEGRRWSQANTILVDDGMEKARAEPWSLVEVPEFSGLKGGKDERGDVDDLAEVLRWMEEARRWSDVSAFTGAMGMRFGVGKDWGELANSWSRGRITTESANTSVETQTRQVNGDNGESGTEDSDSDGGVRLPLNDRRSGRGC